MINRQTERSCSFQQMTLIIRKTALTCSVVAALAVIGGVLAPDALAAGMVKGDQLGGDATLLDPAISKTFPFDDLSGERNDLALFPKARTLRNGPGLDQEARCSWWLPKELPLGGGFSFALFCGDKTKGGPEGPSLPLLGES